MREAVALPPSDFLGKDMEKGDDVAKAAVTGASMSINVVEGRGEMDKSTRFRFPVKNNGIPDEVRNNLLGRRGKTMQCILTWKEKYFWTKCPYHPIDS